MPEDTRFEQKKFLGNPPAGSWENQTFCVSSLRDHFLLTETVKIQEFSRNWGNFFRYQRKPKSTKDGILLESPGCKLVVSRHFSHFCCLAAEPLLTQVRNFRVFPVLSNLRRNESRRNKTGSANERRKWVDYIVRISTIPTFAYLTRSVDELEIPPRTRIMTSCTTLLCDFHSEQNFCRVSCCLNW